MDYCNAFYIHETNFEESSETPFSPECSGENVAGHLPTDSYYACHGIIPPYSLHCKDKAMQMRGCNQLHIICRLKATITANTVFTGLISILDMVQVSQYPLCFCFHQNSPSSIPRGEEESWQANIPAITGLLLTVSTPQAQCLPELHTVERQTGSRLQAERRTSGTDLAPYII